MRIYEQVTSRQYNEQMTSSEYNELCDCEDNKNGLECLIYTTPVVRLAAGKSTDFLTQTPVAPSNDILKIAHLLRKIFLHAINWGPRTRLKQPRTLRVFISTGL